MVLWVSSTSFRTGFQYFRLWRKEILRSGRVYLVSTRPQFDHGRGENVKMSVVLVCLYILTCSLKVPGHFSQLFTLLRFDRNFNY